MILEELEDDIALGRVWVKALIVLLVVLLHKDNGVLSLSHVKVICSSVHTECVCLKTA